MRRAQPELGDLQQEIKAVLKTLNEQLEVLANLENEINSQEKGWSALHGRNFDKAPKRELPLLRDCIIHVETRIRTFELIWQSTSELEAWFSDKVATTKDRHDKAIYVFTIVTVIFLPLSFVSGFLGMNTSDIRATDNRQWIFWIIAIPLTLIVIFIALLFSGELGNAWKVFLGLVRPRQDGPGRLPKIAKTSQGVKATVPKSPQQPLVRQTTLDVFPRPYRRTSTFMSEME